MTSADMDIFYLLFDAANMHRWNDHMCPIDLTELDKQAHKMTISWVLGKFEEHKTDKALNWSLLIEHSLFSFVQRIILTDLKPELFHKMKKECEKELNEFVVCEFDKRISNVDKHFRERFIKYLSSNTASNREDEIIRAAHYLATLWEFNLIYNAYPSMYGISETKENLENSVKEHGDLAGVSEYLMNKSIRAFVDLCGQLRFQKRWAKVPRMPQTTVLGHMLMVADMVYLNDIDDGVNDNRIYNDYFTALFHDLPEVLTKDVISPLKNNIGGLDNLLHVYENELMNSKVLPLLPNDWHEEFLFFIDDPFSKKENDSFGKIDGPMIKKFDMLAAYMEAHISRRYGVSSATLKTGEEELRKKLENDQKISSLISRLDSMRV